MNTEFNYKYEYDRPGIAQTQNFQPVLSCMTLRIAVVKSVLVL